MVVSAQASMGPHDHDLWVSFSMTIEGSFADVNNDLARKGQLKSTITDHLLKYAGVTVANADVVFSDGSLASGRRRVNAEEPRRGLQASDYLHSAHRRL